MEYLLLGDIYQIEAIKFGNWFNFARYFVGKNSVYELSTPYRARDKQLLLDMWGYVRNFDANMFERLQANGFISTLNESIFEKYDDEIILCLGYDGLYGINNINRFMQKVNPSKPVEWGNWTYKVGDRVLFNESKRFGMAIPRITTLDNKNQHGIEYALKEIGNVVKKVLIFKPDILGYSKGICFERLIDEGIIGLRLQQNINILQQYIFSYGLSDLAEKLTASDCPLR